MKRIIHLALCLACLVLTACATQTGMSEELDRNVKAYSKLLRWHEAENAVQTYVAPERRGEFLKQAETLKKNGLTITDFRILSTTFIPESKSGDVITEFDYYILPSNRIRTVSHRQQWVYQENSRSWKLTNGLPPFE